MIYEGVLMEQKQYDAMQIIMQCSRAYADQMKKCMEHSGLFDNGFHLVVNVAPSKETGEDSWLNIELSEYRLVVGDEQYNKNRMEQFKFGERGWIVQNDPKAKAGTVPQNYGSKTTTDDGERVAEETRHPYPPDNLWISSRDYCPVLGGGQ